MEDMEMAIESLEDELEGVKRYSEMMSKVMCPELKKILYENMQTEKMHASNLLKWVNAKAHEVLK